MRRTLYFDRQGNEISLRQFYALAIQPDYVRVAFDRINDSLIVTMWHGTHVPAEPPAPGRPHLVLRTSLLAHDVNGVFEISALEDYATEAEAKTGHARYVSEARQRAAGSTTGEMS